ncbi:hypothetical protein BDZ89DRAFT_531154 [Hymenopellis radicata]|nr:hypothetical protein BDZ89DRAFT_531154 [Hymenopellis radicata]
MVEHALPLEIPDFSDVVENKTTFLRLSRYLSSNIPESIPKGPSTDTRDTQILVVACLRHLEVAVQDSRLLQHSVNATDALMLISRLMPRMTAWMSYLARNIMVQRDFGRLGDVAASMIFLLNIICCIPQLASQLGGLPDHSNPTRAFLSETFPLIALHIFSSPTSECQPKYVWSAFNIIKFLHCMKADLPYAEDVERRFIQEPFLVVKAFTFTVIGSYEILMASTHEGEASYAVFMIMTVHHVLEFLDTPAFREESLRQDHVRWTCIALKAMCVCPLLRNEVNVLLGTGELIPLDATLRCVKVVAMRLGRLLFHGDVVWVGRQILDPEHDVMFHLLRFYQLVKLRCVQRNKPLDEKVIMVDAVWSHILTSIKPYLFCYALLRPARRLLSRLSDAKPDEDPALTSFEQCILQFDRLREAFYERMPTLCDNAACPNLNDMKKPKRCAACRLFFYCCTSCQRDSWRHGHRERCAQIRESLTAAQDPECSAIDIAFLKYILVLSSVDLTASTSGIYVFDLTTDDPIQSPEVSYEIDLFKSLDNFAELAPTWSAGEGILICVVLPTIHETTERRLFLVSNQDLAAFQHESSITYRANDRQLLFP